MNIAGLYRYIRHLPDCGVWANPPVACSCGLAAWLAQHSEGDRDQAEEVRCAGLMADSRCVFVFGSNRAGRHGAGAARAALKYGAVYGVGEGLRGRSYALPTKDEDIQTLPLSEVLAGVRRFIAFAQANPMLQFVVTRIGCGLAGYTDAQIGPLFVGAPANCYLPKGWG